ncbi:DUF2017 domain-containing protein [Streptomyces sp. NPDC058374]|uniref:DUF2017 domain-containing protein n=1 Tax=unclassified Streptomyces TaxID=2593676 RepID=UPI003661865B
MAGYFEPTEKGAAAALDAVEISIIRSLAVQLLELIGPGDDHLGDDPLAELFAEGPSEAPTDPVLRRLFPDAYADPATADTAQEAEELRARSAEFRRFTENDLRAAKRESALLVVRTLDAVPVDGEGGGTLELTPEQSRQWIGALNDLRLAIAARLDLRDESDTDELFQLPDSDPRKPMVIAQLWLAGLQESLIETLAPPS